MLRFIVKSHWRRSHRSRSLIITFICLLMLVCLHGTVGVQKQRWWDYFTLNWFSYYFIISCNWLWGTALRFRLLFSVFCVELICQPPDPVSLLRSCPGWSPCVPGWGAPCPSACQCPSSCRRSRRTGAPPPPPPSPPRWSAAGTPSTCWRRSVWHRGWW